MLGDTVVRIGKSLDEAKSTYDARKRAAKNLVRNATSREGLQLLEASELEMLSAQALCQ